MTELRKWKFSDIWAWLKNAALATLKGELLLRLHVSRYFIHIIYTFFLFWVSIWLSLRIEKTLTRVEDNRKVLADMEIYHAQKTVELAGLSRMSKVQAMLEESGSKLTMPEKPADRVKRITAMAAPKQNTTKKEQDRIGLILYCFYIFCCSSAWPCSAGCSTSCLSGSPTRIWSDTSFLKAQGAS